MKIWSCKIGECDPALVPDGGDAPMRQAVARAYRDLTGRDPTFNFSGWGAALTEGERAVVENREPRPSEPTEAQVRAVADAALGELLGRRCIGHELEAIRGAYPETWEEIRQAVGRRAIAAMEASRG